ncbi:MAG: D-2-hydroxyacid dehydrogenase family protein [Chloroflexi bacterium]|nr:D-2-hydroxyacid dehydrogenase family protein [Chloroflexota bacterium]
MKVVILDDYHRAYGGSPHISRLRMKVEVVVQTDKLADDDATAAALAGAEAVVANRERTRFTADLIARLGDLKLLVQTGNHHYHVDLDALNRAGIRLTMVPGNSAAIVTELTICMMIALMRGVVVGHEGIRNGGWPLLMGRALQGKTLGILGMGRIGRSVAKVAQALGMHVIAWGPTYDDLRAAETGVMNRPLEEVLRASDVVSVHLPLSDLSRGLLSRERLSLMKPSAILVNTARGAIVDEATLAELLRDRKIGGAALDVFVEEPLPVESALRRLDNVLLTPHIGWPTDATYDLFARRAADRILKWQAGEEIPIVKSDPLAVAAGAQDPD